jgi:hypothetical protein
MLLQDWSPVTYDSYQSLTFELRDVYDEGYQCVFICGFPHVLSWFTNESGRYFISAATRGFIRTKSSLDVFVPPVLAI